MMFAYALGRPPGTAVPSIHDGIGIAHVSINIERVRVQPRKRILMGCSYPRLLSWEVMGCSYPRLLPWGVSTPSVPSFFLKKKINKKKDCVTALLHSERLGPGEACVDVRVDVVG